MDDFETDKCATLQCLTGETATKPNSCTVYEPRDDDVIIVGAPKTGTTWLQQILHQMRTKGDESFRDIYDVTWYLNSYGASEGDIDLNADQVCVPRIYKHHESFGVIKMTDKQKHVVITRDPYDSAYSMQKWRKRWFGQKDDMNEDAMIETIVSMHNANKLSSFKTTATWFEHRNDSNVLFVFYEDFIKNLTFMIAKLVTFLNMPLTTEESDKIYSMCTFEYMAKHKEKFQDEMGIEYWAKNMGVEKWTPKMGMVREDGGKVGQGESNIGDRLKAVIDRLWQETVGVPNNFKDYTDMYTKFSMLSL